MAEGREDVDEAPSVDAIAINLAIRLGFLLLFLYFALTLVAPFVGVLLWAVILTVAVHPIYVWLRRLLGGRGGLAAAVITLTGLGLILGPTAALSVSLAESVQALVASMRSGALALPSPPDGVREWPLIGPQLHEAWTLAASNLGATLLRYRDVLAPIGGAALGKAAGLGGGVLMFAASVLVAGFLYAPGPAMAEQARRFARRIVAPRGGEFVDMAGATIRNVSRGVIGVSLLQAILAGIGLTVADVPGAGLIALAALLLGIVQIGPGLVLFPAVIWAWTAMDTTPALLFTIYMVPVTLVDNVLKPVLMSRGLKTPMLVILGGVIGGTLAYGLVGLFLGPVVLAVFYELLVAWVAAAPEESGTGRARATAAPGE